MRRKQATSLGLVLSIILCLNLLAGCGKNIDRGEPPETGRPASSISEDFSDETYSISAYYDNNDVEVSLDFYDDYTFYYSDENQIAEGTYYFSGEDFQLQLDGETYDGYIASDGVLSLYDVDGYFYVVEEVGYYPDSGKISIEDSDDVGKEYISEDGGRTRYRDYEGHIAVSYPEWMTNYEDDLLYGSVLLSDNDGGFVLGINVTDSYWAFDGADEDYLLQLYNEEITDVFNQIYDSDWNCGSLDLLPTVKNNHLAVGEANLYSDDYDINVRTYLYRTLNDGELTDHVVAKVFFTEYGDSAQLEMLMDEVTRCVTVH